ncbi:hypothetical protein RRSWK_00806 [Rhodopirellula sp. SWK7]|nr:hypothetical protein RRSWK_00806 [Rhodopirellula sp. SWK7]
MRQRLLSQDSNVSLRDPDHTECDRGTRPRMAGFQSNQTIIRMVLAVMEPHVDVVFKRPPA